MSRAYGVAICIITYLAQGKEVRIISEALDLAAPITNDCPLSDEVGRSGNLIHVLFDEGLSRNIPLSALTIRSKRHWWECVVTFNNFPYRRGSYNVVVRDLTKIHDGLEHRVLLNKGLAVDGVGRHLS